MEIRNFGEIIRTTIRDENVEYDICMRNFATVRVTANTVGRVAIIFRRVAEKIAGNLKCT